MRLAALHDFDFVCIDTEDVFVGTGMGREMALTAQGKYHHLDNTGKEIHIVFHCSFMMLYNFERYSDQCHIVFKQTR